MEFHSEVVPTSGAFYTFQYFYCCSRWSLFACVPRVATMQTIFAKLVTRYCFEIISFISIANCSRIILLFCSYFVIMLLNTGCETGWAESWNIPAKFLYYLVARRLYWTEESAQAMHHNDSESDFGTFCCHWKTRIGKVITYGICILFLNLNIWLIQLNCHWHW